MLTQSMCLNNYRDV